MKAVIVTEHPANPATVDPQYRESIKPVTRIYAGKPKVEWVWPAGVAVEGAKAISLVRYGLAKPTDQECADACGMTPEQVRIGIEMQEMAQKGVHSKEDQELYRAGVIKGYKPKAGGGVEYDWGPNAESYKAALKSVKEQSDDDE